ncbi:MAG: S8 family serine peptidase [Bacteroidales bacterium]
MNTNISIQAQNNLDIIEYFEAIKIISSHKYNLPDTPVIAIIDKGLNLQHEDLLANIWANNQEISSNGIDDDQNGYIDDIHGWNFANNTNDVSIGGIGNWHGTPVNGIIGAENENNLGVKGISPKVKLMNLVKGESIESIINSLQYVFQMRKTYNQTNGQKGAYIVAVNCSWGKDSLWASDYPDWCTMYDSLGSVGVLSVHSVPNDNIDIDVYGDMPATSVSNFLITVTNSNQYDEKVYDAGFGKYSVDLAAPGDHTYTTLNPGNYGYFGGTSAAAPYVSGTIGLMYLLPSVDFQKSVKNNPSFTASIVKTAIMKGVDSSPDCEKNTVSGGRLNAFKSIKLLCDYYGEQQLYKNLFEPINIISVYPNPASTHTSLQIECNTDLDISINIADLNGKNVLIKNSFLKEGIGIVPIDLSGLHKGFYIVNVTSPEVTKSIKLIIQ